MTNRISYLLIILALFLAGCASGATYMRRLSSEAKWQTAEAHFERGRFNRAIPYYQQLVFERSSIYVADAQFKLGECYFLRRGRDNLVDAIFEYQEFLRLFPDHILSADAQFRIGEAYLRLSLGPDFTQDESNRAIESFTRFIEKYPHDSRVPEAFNHIAEMQLKILEKVYLTGYIYYKMKDFPAAQLYLNEIIALGNRNDLEKMAMFYTALIHIERQEETEALEAIEHLRRHFPGSKELRRAERRFGRMNSRFFRLFYSL